MPDGDQPTPEFDPDAPAPVDDDDSDDVDEQALQQRWGDARDPDGDGDDVDAAQSGYEQDDQ